MLDETVVYIPTPHSFQSDARLQPGSPAPQGGARLSHCVRLDAHRKGARPVHKFQCGFCGYCDTFFRFVCVNKFNFNYMAEGCPSVTINKLCNQFSDCMLHDPYFKSDHVYRVAGHFCIMQSTAAATANLYKPMPCMSASSSV